MNLTTPNGLERILSTEYPVPASDIINVGGDLRLRLYCLCKRSSSSAAPHLSVPIILKQSFRHCPPLDPRTGSGETKANRILPNTAAPAPPSTHDGHQHSPRHSLLSGNLRPSRLTALVAIRDRSLLIHPPTHHEA
jgi:hypothetical protein